MEALMIFGIMRLVKRKWPMWFVANVVSIPSSESVNLGIAITPALLTRMSIAEIPSSSLTLAAAVRTEAWDARSIIKAWY